MFTIDFNLSCAHCNASLQGIPLDGTCGKCGAPIKATIDLPLLNEETGLVEADVSCIRCSYNLRSLSLTGICPECGRSVTDSLRPDVLWLAEPNWRKSILQGLNLFLVAGIGIPAILLTLLTVQQTGRDVAMGITAILGGLAILLLSFMIIGAVLCVSARDTTRLEKTNRFWPHEIAGSLPILNILSVLLLGAFGLAISTLHTIGFTLIMLGVFLLAGSSILSLVALIACLRSIAARARAPRLRRATLWWLAGLMSTFALYIIAVLVTPQLARTPHGHDPASELLIGFLALVACTLYVLAIVGLGTYRKILHEANVRFTIATISVPPPTESGDS